MPYRFRGERPSASEPTDSLLLPGLEGFLERTLAGRALFECQNGPPIVAVDDRNIEPATVLEQLHIALAIGIGRRQPDQEEADGDLDGEAGQRRAAALP